MIHTLASIHPALETFTPELDAVGGSLGLSALVACIPLVTFFVMLLGVRAKAHTSGLVALVAALIVAILAFKMPTIYALVSATYGAAYGAFPIVYIILMAVWLYEVTVISGRSDDLRGVFDKIGGGDIRIQAMVIAFGFGGLLEAFAGFGSPIAVTATMLLALGVKPLKAALAVLLANTAPVAYGAVGTPITMAGKMASTTAGGDAEVADAAAAHVASIVGHQAPLFALVVPLLLIIVLDGMKGAKELWLPALIFGGSFAITQWLVSGTGIWPLTDVIASIVGVAVIVVFMRFWTPQGADEARERMGIAPNEEVGDGEELTAMRTFMALLPYLVTVLVFSFAKLVTPIKDGIAKLENDVIGTSFSWPVISATGSGDDAVPTIINAVTGKDAVSAFNFNILSTPGTMLLLSGLITAFIYSFFHENGRYKVTFSQTLKSIGETAYRMRFSALTIILVLSLAYVMNYSGQTHAIGTFLAGAGALYAVISPLLGWVGTAVTGSDTSANALFGSLQHTSAIQNPALQNVTPDLFLAANTQGGVVGKMISPQSLAIASAATQEHEADIMKKVLPWSIGLLVATSLLILLQSTVFSGMDVLQQFDMDYWKAFMQ